MSIKDTHIITSYIGAFAWQIIAVQFLMFSLLFFSLEITVFFVASLALFAFAEFRSWRKKKDFEHADNSTTIR